MSPHTTDSSTTAPAGTGRVARYAAGGAVVCLLVVLIAKLSVGPVHGVSDAAGCARAYANAHTRTDTIAADLLSFPDPSGHGITRRCFELRPVAVAAPGR